MIIAIIIFAVIMFHLVVWMGWILYKLVIRPSSENKVVDSELPVDTNPKS